MPAAISRPTTSAFGDRGEAFRSEVSHLSAPGSGRRPGAKLQAGGASSPRRSARRPRTPSSRCVGSNAQALELRWRRGASRRGRCARARRSPRSPARRHRARRPRHHDRTAQAEAPELVLHVPADGLQGHAASTGSRLLRAAASTSAAPARPEATRRRTSAVAASTSRQERCKNSRRPASSSRTTSSKSSSGGAPRRSARRRPPRRAGEEDGDALLALRAEAPQVVRRPGSRRPDHGRQSCRVRDRARAGPPARRPAGLRFCLVDRRPSRPSVAIVVLGSSAGWARPGASSSSQRGHALIHGSSASGVRGARQVRPERLVALGRELRRTRRKAAERGSQPSQHPVEVRPPHRGRP